MEVILREKIHKLGSLGERVRVRPGYGRNYLLPNNLAVLATPENIEKFEVERVVLEKRQQSLLLATTARAEALAELSITLDRRAGAEGRLFGSVTAADIADATTKAGVNLEKNEVLMPDGPLRVLGEHVISLRLRGNVVTTLRLTVRAE